MTDGERIDFLIKTLEKDNAVMFAKRTGLHPSVISRIRNGECLLNRRIEPILMSYPEVNRIWLETGEGYPGDLTIDITRKHYLEVIKAKDKIIESLGKELDLQRSLIEEMRKGKA